jgi:hypothetical protein
MGIKEVAAGAAWLDENFPGWEREIDLGTLDMNDCQACICGQSLRQVAKEAGAHSGYDHAKALNADDWGTGYFWAENHGFTCRDGKWYALEELWSNLIKERFSSGNLSDN